jgi:Cft2 family RNA processing exonuclease
MYVPEIELWLDPGQPVETAWFSHAHGDHARGYPESVLSTTETYCFYRLRWPESGGQKFRALEFGVPVPWRDATLTAYPAAHIVGAAQLLIERQGYRLLYTGDLKARAPICGRETEPARCHRLIIESTFGLPIFHFLDREAARERMVRFAQTALAEKATPVFYGYPLGRGQEVAHALATAGVPVALHGAMVKFLPGYEAAGYGFPGWSPYEPRQVSGKALVVVAGMRDVLEASGRDVRIAYVSGWAAMANARQRVGAHELIPYSDHAGFTELLDLVSAYGPEEIDIVHGYAEPFAAILRGRGWNARAATALGARSEEEQEIRA